jgi:transmembrane sensor
MKDANGNTFSWKNQILEFVDTPVEQAIGDISKHYKIKIDFDKNLTLKSSCLLTSTFKNESADQMMKELKTLFGITYFKKGNGYVITSIKC